MDEKDQDNNGVGRERSKVAVMPKPCADICVRTGGFQKIEERTWNVMRARRMLSAKRSDAPNNNQN
ncbi:hypothetical protein ACHHYP_15273 [Achlya hypogyna]|uniref:Uncharacterized protein n=1 Tax=Achlya hypogyna TaxID=1202772 RepID=A0A1V9YBA1_ACHHY|nr:hypothetical protein ACHHYP_15273 [Achlya hypogyna]